MKLGTRLGIVIFTLGACAFAGYVQFQERAIEREPVPSELFDVVQSGIIGLRSQHYQQVYLQASARCKDRLTLDSFIDSARTDFLSLRRAVRWEFGGPVSAATGVTVPVRFFTESGDILETAFTLVREDRSWKIEHFSVSPTALPPRTIGGIRL